MNTKIKQLIHGAVIGALYVILTFLQLLIFPESTSGAIQFRASEMLMIFALFSPSAVFGLTIGCAIVNIFNGLPLDFLIGSFATLLAGLLIYWTRNIKIKDFPILAVLFPALCNGILVGLEIQLFYIGDFTILSFLIQFSLVFIGELAVMLILGTPFYYTILKTNLHKKMK